MCVCLQTCVCMCTCECMCTCVYVSICVSPYVPVYKCERMCVCTSVCMLMHWVCACACSCCEVWTCVWVWVCMWISICLCHLFMCVYVTCVLMTMDVRREHHIYYWSNWNYRLLWAAWKEGWMQKLGLLKEHQVLLSADPFFPGPWNQV